MRLLLDTCALLWFLRDDTELSTSAALAIENPANEVVVSVVSIWEIAIKAALGKIQAPKDLENGLEGMLAQSGFTLLDVKFPHAAGVFSLPRVHGDPFDRLLISQCRMEKLIAVTNDTHWAAPEYELRVLW